jgi:hypothetical protein
MRKCEIGKEEKAEFELLCMGEARKRDRKVMGYEGIWVLYHYQILARKVFTAFNSRSFLLLIAFFSRFGAKRQ